MWPGTTCRSVVVVGTRVRARVPWGYSSPGRLRLDPMSCRGGGLKRAAGGAGMVARRSRGWPMQQAHAQAYPYNNKVGHGLSIGGTWHCLGCRAGPPSSASDSTSLPGQISPCWATSHGPGGPVSTRSSGEPLRMSCHFPLPSPFIPLKPAPQHPRVHLLVGLESGWPWDSDADRRI